MRFLQFDIKNSFSSSFMSVCLTPSPFFPHFLCFSPPFLRLSPPFLPFFPSLPLFPFPFLFLFSPFLFFFFHPPVCTLSLPLYLLSLYVPLVRFLPPLSFLPPSSGRWSQLMESGLVNLIFLNKLLSYVFPKLNQPIKETSGKTRTSGAVPWLPPSRISSPV